MALFKSLLQPEDYGESRGSKALLTCRENLS
jgi:hypothetical protein